MKKRSGRGGEVWKEKENVEENNEEKEEEEEED